MKKKVIALIGNPNVGKSSLFNRLTGLSRHTGNWTGKTVDSAIARCKDKAFSFYFADLPGAYSLVPKSPDEEVTGDFLIFENPEKTVVVADATCLKRTAIILFEVLEITKNAILCINFSDEAKRQGIRIDKKKLSDSLKIPVIEISARKGTGIDELMTALQNENRHDNVYVPHYTKSIEDAINILMPYMKNELGLSERWLAIKLLEGDLGLFLRLKNKFDYKKAKGIDQAVLKANEILRENGLDNEKLKETISSCRVLCSEETIDPCYERKGNGYRNSEKVADRIFTGRITSIIVMLLLLGFLFWLTLSGANAVSGVLGAFLDRVLAEISGFLTKVKVPDYIKNPLCDGVLHILFKVISVMTPPMAIFFPLFTLLEDLGYLPRVAFNLDRFFKKCSSCGKQAYSMCMGFGCNAAGVCGCRIIDSERERTLAILTNCFVPCNGKFPALTTLIMMFVIFGVPSGLKMLSGAAVLTVIVILSVLMTFFMTFILSKTLYKGKPSSFTLELPPYRRPEIKKIIVRSFLDRGVFLIGRAALVAAPCGLIVWCMANLRVNDVTLLDSCAGFLEPIGKILGMDGTILLSFILGFPANEIIIPLIITGYSSLGTLAPDGGIEAIRMLFIENGWTPLTAINVIIFMLFHWPCSTTLITIKRETKSTILAALAFIIPTLTGVLLCALTTLIYNVISM